MAKRVQRRRGTTAEHAAFTGAVGEVTVDLDKDTLVVHDGVTSGGIPLLREDFTNLPAGENIPGSTTWTSLGLGDAAAREVGIGPANLVENSALGTAAYKDTGLGTGEVLEFVDAGKLPVLDGSALINLPLTSDNITFQVNSHVMSLRLSEQNNLNVQLLADGIVDNFETEDGVNVGASVNQTYNTGNNSYNNDPSVAVALDLRSISYTLEFQPDFVTVTLIEEDVDAVDLNAHLWIQASRDGGTTWNLTFLTVRGYFDFPSGPKRILSGVIDVSGQPAATSILWRIRTTDDSRLVVFGIGISWR